MQPALKRAELGDQTTGSEKRIQPNKGEQLTMKLIRYEKPNVGSSSLNLENWFGNGDRFFGLRNWPNLFDWNFPGVAENRLGADLFEDDDAYYARFELPGVKKADVNIELHNAVLSVSHHREWKSGEDDEGASTESLSRSLSVPDDIDPERISAKHEDGLLTVTMPKREAAKPRVISVK
jgi:HSP20 family protein